MLLASKADIAEKLKAPELARYRHWLKQKRAGDPAPLAAYSLGASLAAGGKFIQQTLGDGVCPSGASWCRACLFGKTVIFRKVTADCLFARPIRRR